MPMTAKNSDGGVVWIQDTAGDRDDGPDDGEYDAGDDPGDHGHHGRPRIGRGVQCVHVRQVHYSWLDHH